MDDQSRTLPFAQYMLYLCVRIKVMTWRFSHPKAEKGVGRDGYLLDGKSNRTSEKS